MRVLSLVMTVLLLMTFLDSATGIIRVNLNYVLQMRMRNNILTCQRSGEV